METKEKEVEKTVTHTEEEFNAMIARSYNDGLEDGKAMGESIKKDIKNKVLATLRQHASNLFFAKQDELAKEIRKLVDTFNNL